MTSAKKDFKMEQPETNAVRLYNANCKSNLFLLDMKRDVVIRVNKQEFVQAEGPVVFVNNFTVKIITGSRANLMKYKKIFYKVDRFTAEGLLGLIGVVYKSTATFTQIAYKIMKQESDVETNAILLDVVSLILQHSSTTYNNWTPSYFVGFLSRIYSLFIRAKQFMTRPLVSESLDSTMLLAGAIGLPDAFFNVLKRINMMTSKKIGDHPGLFLEGIQMLSTYLSKIVSSITWIPETIKNLLMKMFTFGDFQLQVMEMQNSLLTWKNDKRILADAVFRVKIFEQKEKLDKHPDTVEKLRIGINFKVFYGEFSKMVSSAKAFEKCSRQEPVLIVLEGPPGVKKTIAMLKIIKLLNMSVYTHIVKSTEDGKDFYDGYNNEDVFVMDDVGQQGVSQWRTVINMVSSVRMPLECASVDLKDTKYFDSKVILVTTNNFTNLGGLTKSDGISDIKALWRRAQVFTFKNERTIAFKRFDVASDNWVSKPIFGSKIIDEFKGDNLELSVFITAYIKKSLHHYSELASVIELTPSQVQMAQDRVEELLTEYYDAQGWTSATMTILSHWQFAQNYVEDLLRMIYDFVIEHSTSVQACVIGVCVFQCYKFYCDYSNFSSISQQETNLDVVNAWNTVASHKGKVVEIKESKVYTSEGLLGTLVESVKKNIKLVKILLKNNSFEVSHCLVSGTKILLPAHVVYDSVGSLILYNSQNDFVNEVRALDHSTFDVILEDKVNDVAILEIPLLNKTPYKNISSYFKFKNKVARNPYFVWSGEPIRLEGTYVPSDILPKYITRYGEVVISEPLTYEMSAKGFCGSVIVDDNAGVIGFHVAGDGNLGISKIFSQSLVAKIYNCLNDSIDSTIVLDESPNEAFSGMIGKTTKRSDGPKNTHLKMSVLADLHPETKKPANLRALGDHTVKKRAMRMHKNVTTMLNEELQYMKDFLLFIIPNFTSLTEEEVIKGNANLAAINKDSVSGMDFPLEKEEYFDFETGKCKENFRLDLDQFRLQCKFGYPEKITQHHTIKDELRLMHKVDKPRTFGVDSLITQYEMKRLMGNLMIQLKERKWENGLAIGINPYKDWPQLYDKLAECLITWDGDIGEYDASVSPQIQALVNEVVLKKFYGSEEDKLILKRVLALVIQSWVVAGNKLLYKTHGVLSGMWITNLFNSLYNRCYSAGWYYRMMIKKKGTPNTISRFLQDVVDFVQGDDKICGVKRDQDVLNALTMRDYYMSNGMTFTDGEKGEIDYISKELSDCVFLKRKFKFHDELHQIVGPLSLETITNSIRWYKDDNDEKEIIRDKYHVYQRELYLHGREGMQILEKAKSFIKERNLGLQDLSMDYLRKTYLDDPDYWYSFSQQVQNKFY